MSKCRYCGERIEFRFKPDGRKKVALDLRMRIVVPTENERDRVFYRLRIGIHGEQWVEPFNGIEACKGCNANTERAFVNHSEVCRCRAWFK